MAEAPKPAPATGRQGIMSLSLKDKGALYAAYMPFIKNGGMFIPSAKAYQLGDEVFILLTLMDETEKLPVAGRIVWLTPKGAQGNRPAGIGVQFSEIDGGSTRSKIEGYLAGLLQAERATNTL
ncbi:MAG: PilZ domain-containing protein [Proteobacteria bacterium]|nr:PilZ domain-containing protein [Pseudomonadota bacterium]